MLSFGYDFHHTFFGLMRNAMRYELIIIDTLISNICFPISKIFQMKKIVKQIDSVMFKQHRSLVSSTIAK